MSYDAFISNMTKYVNLLPLSKVKFLYFEAKNLKTDTNRTSTNKIAY